MIDALDASHRGYTALLDLAVDLMSCCGIDSQSCLPVVVERLR